MEFALFMSKELIKNLTISNSLKLIATKVLENQRINEKEAVELYQSNDLALLGMLATHRKKHTSGNHVYFNRNFHIEPTNICTMHCKFCSYRRRKGQKGAWESSIDEMVEIIKKQMHNHPTEVHVVGAVHPDRDINFYVELIGNIRKTAPEIHIKGFTAVEIDKMCTMANISIEKGLKMLKEVGLQSMPGGGAEIFDETIRKEICPDKTDSTKWLDIHKTAHNLGLPTNTTMLYGLIENYEHRVDHLNRLRILQDETAGFNAFIPLKFKHANNLFSKIKESTIVEDLKNYAISRIFLDNIPHIKAYWPMIGKQTAQLSLDFGVDDLDGTIDDSTRIYSMAGGVEKPSLSTDEIIKMIVEMQYQPVERDSIYNIIKEY